jgi:protein-S-isoprenylcysteine O-methyltransferase Ste14
MKERFLKQAGREYSPRRRIAALMIEGVFFLGLLPAFFVVVSPRLDRLLGLPSLAFGAVNLVVGCGLIAAGLLFAWWSIYVQFTVGRGTPVPLMATQELIVQRPYSYCRNPMALGTIVAVTGVAALIGSISALAIILLGAALLLTYIKILEEKEMVLRFGKPYEEYRRRTPFIFPRLRRRD